MPPAGQTGPGGCKTQEECQSYCQTNPQECQNFQGNSGQQIPNIQIPQQGINAPTCNSPEECQKTGEQIQNQIIPQTPPPCQGENCTYGPPPSGTSPQGPGPIPQQYQQPPTGGTNGTIPGTDQPIIQTPQNAPGEQIAPQLQQTAPPPSSEPAPSPAPAPGGETTPPPPTSLNNPNLFMGLIMSAFSPLSRPFLYGK